MRVLIAVLLAAMTLSVNAQQGTETVRALTVTVGANHAPPYRVIEGGPPTGLYVDIFREITDRLGWKTHYREAPFRRVLKMVQQGEVDVMLGVLKTPERDNLMVFVMLAFPSDRRVFLYMDDSNRIERYADVVVAPELIGRYALGKLGLQAKASPFFMPGERSWIAVAKTSPVLEYSDDIRAAFKLIEAEGVYENLVLKYMDQYAQ